MKLVIGGAEQGKREVACRLFGCELSDFADGRSCDLTAIESCRAISCFHMYLLRRLRAEGQLDADTFAEELCRVNPELLIVSDEIGYGIVPIEKEQRVWRELTGRVCCRLADFSDTVVRVVAGIPTVLKQAEGMKR